MRAVPVGVASIVPHVTVRGNGGVGTRSDFRAGACPVARSPSCGGRQRVDAVVEFPEGPGTPPRRLYVVCGTGPPQRPEPPCGVGAVVVLAVGALGGAAAAHGRLDAVGEAAGGEQEAGVADHPVVGADGEALHVPVADHRLPGGRLVEAADLADGLDGPGQLGGGRDVAAQDAAGHEGLLDDVQALPRGEHVQDDAVDVGVGQVVLEVADGELPGGVRAAEVALHVLLGDLGEVLAALVGVQHALVADGAQQEAAEGAGAHACFHDACAGEDVGEGEDLPRVLRVDDGCPSGHGQDVVGEQGAQREVGDVPGGADDAALGSTDQFVVGEGTLVGVEVLPGLERERVVAALGVGQLNLVPDREGPAPAGGTGRFGHVTSLPVPRRGLDQRRRVVAAGRANGPGRTALLAPFPASLRDPFSWALPWP